MNSESIPAHAGRPSIPQDPDTASSGGADPRLPLLVVNHEGADAGGEPGLVRRFLRLLPVVTLLVAVGGVVGLYFQPPGLQRAMALLELEPGAGSRHPIAVPPARAAAPEPRASMEPQTDTVAGLGTLVPEGDVIAVAVPYGSGDATVATLRVAEGDRVQAGDVLAVLDNERQLAAARESARATLAVSQAALNQTRASVNASLREAKAALERARAAALNARQEFERVLELQQRRVVSRASLDLARANRDQTLRDVEQAEATLSRYAADTSGLQVDVLLAERNLDAARAELQRANGDLEKARVRTPISGTVLSIAVSPGERPGERGLMNIGNIDHMTAEVEVYQDLVGAVSVGQPVELVADAFPSPLTGTVSRVGLEVGKQTVLGEDPAASTDARVVEVKVSLDEPSSRLASRFTNLQVVARIKVHPGP